MNHNESMKEGVEHVELVEVVEVVERRVELGPRTAVQSPMFGTGDPHSGR